MIYYNENDLKKAAMLQQLMADGHIPKGDIDTRSITEVKADEIRHYTQCHFFAGIGLWALAVARSGWPPNRFIRTGSCPCQSYSAIGKQKGADDDRDLWPYWSNLESQLEPATIFGEQVANAIAHGWLDRIYYDLEPRGYAIAAAVLSACSIGTPQERERLFFVASPEKTIGEFSLGGAESESRAGFTNSGAMDNPFDERLEGYSGHVDYSARRQGQGRSACTPSIFSDLEPIECENGKIRLIKPGIPMLANGYPARVPLIHAIGDAIVWQVAQAFIEAYLENEGGLK